MIVNEVIESEANEIESIEHFKQSIKQLLTATSFNVFGSVCFILMVAKGISENEKRLPSIICNDKNNNLLSVNGYSINFTYIKRMVRQLLNDCEIDLHFLLFRLDCSFVASENIIDDWTNEHCGYGMKFSDNLQDSIKLQSFLLFHIVSTSALKDKYILRFDSNSSMYVFNDKMIIEYLNSCWSFLAVFLTGIRRITPLFYP